MRIVFIASGAFAVPTLRWLAESEHEVSLVVTQPARRAGRGRRTTPTPVEVSARGLEMPTLAVEDINVPEIVARIHGLDVRLGLVIAFGQKLGPELLGSLPGGCINLHASLLPRFRGAAPINRAILEGEEQTGCSVFRVVQRMDAGPILITRRTMIKPEETAGELHDRLSAIGVDAVDATLQLFEGGAIPEGTPQNEDQATKAPKLKKSDGAIRFDRPAADVIRHICGMTPWPGATARFQASDGRWEKVAITRARRAEDLSTPTIPPGTIDERRYVATRDGFVDILEIKPSSSRLMTWQEYINGRHVAAGDTFATP